MGLQVVLRGDWISACWRRAPTSVCQLVLAPQNSITLFPSLSYSLEFFSSLQEVAEGNWALCSFTQSCPTRNPMDWGPPGSSVHGIPRQEYWSGLPHPPPGESSPPRDRNHVSCVSCFGRRILYHWDTWEALFILTCPHMVRRPWYLTHSGSSN